jgi:hypothetical protein
VQSRFAVVNYSAPASAPGAASALGARGRFVLIALAGAAIAAVLGAAFLAYGDPSLALSLENLRLCF